MEKTIEKCQYECETGPLENNAGWLVLKKKVNLWIVVKNGSNIMHTSGNGGYRFVVCTCKEEAQWLADLYNREKYGNEPICTVEHLLNTDKFT